MSFDEANELNRLVEVTCSVRVTSDWSYVRHYLARLRSWYKKAGTIVKFARQYPEIFQSYSVEWLCLPDPARLPEIDMKTNLRSALRRMLPQDESHKAEEIYEALSDLREFNWDEFFVKNFEGDNASLAVHAEVFLMEHFYIHNLPFVENERYIGCSKPSCYCCALYTRYHPGNFVVRPSHGVAWGKWSPPLLGMCEDEKIRKHNLTVMNSVVAHLRRDIFNEIERRLPRRNRPPDSTSGLGTRSF